MAMNKKRIVGVMCGEPSTDGDARCDTDTKA